MYVKFCADLAVVFGAAYSGYHYEHNRFMVFRKEVEVLAKESKNKKGISIQKNKT